MSLLKAIFELFSSGYAYGIWPVLIFLALAIAYNIYKVKEEVATEKRLNQAHSPIKEPTQEEIRAEKKGSIAYIIVLILVLLGVLWFIL